MALITADEFSELFARLEAVRQAQIARGDIDSSALGSVITSPISSAVPISTTNVSSLKSAANQLTNGTEISSTFASNIIIPSVGDLIKQSTTITSYSTQITNIENVCANCSFNSSFNSSFDAGFNSSNDSNFNNFGNFDNDTSFNSSNDFSWNFSTFSANFGNFTRNF